MAGSRNPRTPNQRHWRARFGATSKKYSQSLTDEQQDACIAAGAKARCRPRLGDSGRLTGQQYSIRKEYAEKVKGSSKKAETAAEALQTQGILVSTPGTHRHLAGITPGPHRRDTGRGREDESRTKKEEGSRRKEGPASQMLPPQLVKRYKCMRQQNAARALRWQAASNSGTDAAPRRLTRRRRRGRVL